jgi:hypothetical protein
MSAMSGSPCILLVALFTLAGIVWTALDLRTLARNPQARPARLTALGAVTGTILFVQLLFGALVAGLNAGLVTDQWPLMNGRFFPGATIAGRPFLDALFNDPAIVHFVHRWWAWVTVAALIVLARATRAVDRRASIAIHSAFGLQILLGIATVMSGMNITLAALHQLTGALLVIATVWGRTRSAGADERRRAPVLDLPQPGRGGTRRRDRARGAPRRLREHPRPLFLDLSLAGRHRARRRSPRIVQDHPHLAGQLRDRIAALHPYDLPVIEAWPVSAAERR